MRQVKLEKQYYFGRLLAGAFLTVLVFLTLLPQVAHAAEINQDKMECMEPFEKIGVLQDGDLFPTAEYHDSEKLYLLSADDQNWADAENALYEGMKERRSAINIAQFKLSKEAFLKVWNRTFYGHEDLFYVDWMEQYWTINDSSTGTKYVSLVEIRYKEKYSEEDVELFYETVQKIIDGMPEGLDPQQKTLYLHDYLVTHCEYDLATLEITDAEERAKKGKYDAYNALVEGSAVCQGYSLAYAYLCKRIGVKCYLVSSKQNNHAWNLVELDGRLYFVDCTNDDPSNHWYEARCKHDNYLRSRDGLTSTSNHEVSWKDWTSYYLDNVSEVGIESTKYDSYYWINVDSAMPFIGTLQAYCLSTDRQHVYLRTQYGTEKTISTGVTAWWKEWGKNSYWSGNFMSITAIGDNFYFSTQDAIYRLTTDGEVKFVYGLSDSEKAQGYLYGIVAQGNTIAYNIGTVGWNNENFIRNLLVIPVDTLDVEFKHNCSFGNNLSLYFAIKKSSLNGYENVRLICTRKQCNADGTSYTEVVSDPLTYVENTIGTDTYYMFEYANIAAKNMGDEITAVLYADKKGKTYHSDEDVYSVKEFAYDRLDNTGDAKYRTLVVDMLNYGACAQQYFKYNKDHLVNEGLSEIQKNYGTNTDPVLEGIDSSEATNGAKAEIIKKNVSFGNNIELAFAVTFESGYDPKKAQLEISYLSADNNLKSVIIKGSNLTQTTIEGNSAYVGKITTISAKDLGAEVTAKVTENGTVISNIQKYSVENYAKNRMSNSNDEVFKALIMALMKYGKAAEKYFTK